MRARDTVLLNMPHLLCQSQENAVNAKLYVLIHGLLGVKAAKGSVYLVQYLNDGMAPAGPS